MVTVTNQRNPDEVENSKHEVQEEHHPNRDSTVAQFQEEEEAVATESRQQESLQSADTWARNRRARLLGELDDLIAVEPDERDFSGRTCYSQNSPGRKRQKKMFLAVGSDTPAR